MTPTSSIGQDLATVVLNGTDYGNGSVLPPVISGFNYTFSVVQINQSYAFDQWTSEGANFSNENGSVTGVTFGGGLGSTTLIVTLRSPDHRLVGGRVDTAQQVHSMSAAFTVPSLTWFNVPTGPAPTTGEYEVADWGVGLGGFGGAAGLVTGLEMTRSDTVQGLVSTFQPFWSTSVGGGGGRTNFTGGPAVQASDTIEVSITNGGGYCQSACANLTDTTRHWSYSAQTTHLGSGTVHTGEYLVWDPENGSGHLSPAFSGGSFTNLNFGGSGAGCTVCLPYPPVEYSQWAWDAAMPGWNESLDPGNVSTLVTGPPPVPFDQTLASVVIVLPTWNLAAPSSPLKVLAFGGDAYTNGSSAPMPYDMAGGIGVLNLTPRTLQFGEWGLGPGPSVGVIGNPSKSVTTLTTYEPGGELEALLLLNLSGSLAAGYNESNPIGAGAKTMAASFTFPSTQFNQSAAGLNSREDLQLFVQMDAGRGLNLLAGVRIHYNNSYSNPEVLWFVDFYTNLPAYYPQTYATGLFWASPGDDLEVDLSTYTSNSGGCPYSGAGSYPFCWTVSDLDHSRITGQNGSGNFESFTGKDYTGPYGIYNMPFPVNVSWLVGAPYVSEGACGTGVVCSTPTMSSPVNFTSLAIGGTVISMLGPFEAESADIFGELGSGHPEWIVPSIVSSPASGSFEVTET